MNVSVTLTTSLEKASTDLGKINPDNHTGIIIINSQKLERLFSGGGCEAYYPDGKNAPNLSVCYHRVIVFTL